MSELFQLLPLTFLHYNNPKTLQRTTRRTLVHNITRKSSILNIDDPGAAGPGSWACCAPACTACHLAWPALTADGALHTWGHGEGGKLGHGDKEEQPRPAWSAPWRAA